MVQINSIEKGSRPTELIAGVLGIWEASVRASHHFLTEDDIRSLCPQAEEAIRQIETYGWLKMRMSASDSWASSPAR